MYYALMRSLFRGDGGPVSRLQPRPAAEDEEANFVCDALIKATIAASLSKPDRFPNAILLRVFG